jgi:Bacterial regulatory proteins, tetR family/Tetracyclin repressor-like, C-terminal domain
MATPPFESPPRRRRDPEGHRAAILQAAREALTERGYARATIRDVARRAGVTHGLVMRHFGSKEQLMLAAFPGPPGLDEVVRGDPATLPERLAHNYVVRMEDAAGEDPLVAIIRSGATNERAGASLYEEMRRRSTHALESVLSHDGLEIRGDLIVAILIGVTFERYVMRAGSLAALGADEFERHVAGLLRHVLEPALPARHRDSNIAAAARR